MGSWSPGLDVELYAIAAVIFAFQEVVKSSSSEVKLRIIRIRRSLSWRKVGGWVQCGQVHLKPQLRDIAFWRLEVVWRGSISGLMVLFVSGKFVGLDGGKQGMGEMGKGKRG